MTNRAEFEDIMTVALAMAGAIGAGNRTLAVRCKKSFAC